ncbi:MAG: hypothetical protein A2Z32_02395 [Chloroflexi bacterium RBG_16_69_14]|nr:MAG: hypothetical protein A2Z32_02395 [Chloroflexi bacterium RBG_16_69_14]
MVEQRFLGVVEVDSGTLVIGDPSYFLPQAAEGKSGVEYQTVIKADSSIPGVYLDDRPALLLGRFGGDGTFPVFGEFDKDAMLLRVSVEFVDRDETEDDSWSTLTC